MVQSQCQQTQPVLRLCIRVQLYPVLPLTYIPSSGQFLSLTAVTNRQSEVSTTSSVDANSQSGDQHISHSMVASSRSSAVIDLNPTQLMVCSQQSVWCTTLCTRDIVSQSIGCEHKYESLTVTSSQPVVSPSTVSAVSNSESGGHHSSQVDTNEITVSQSGSLPSSIESIPLQALQSDSNTVASDSCQDFTAE